MATGGQGGWQGGAGAFPFCASCSWGLLPPAVFLWMDEESRVGAVCCAECSAIIVLPDAVRQLLSSRRETRGGEAATEIKPPAHSHSFRK